MLDFSARPYICENTLIQLNAESHMQSVCDTVDAQGTFI